MWFSLPNFACYDVTAWVSWFTFAGFGVDGARSAWFWYGSFGYVFVGFRRCFGVLFVGGFWIVCGFGVFLVCGLVVWCMVCRFCGFCVVGGSLVVRFAGWWLHCFGWFWVLRISWLGFVLVLVLTTCDFWWV